VADFAGVLAPARITTTLRLFAAPRFNYTRGDFIFDDSPVRSGVYASSGVAHGIPVAQPNYPARLARETTPGFDWFDRVHIIPRTRQALGVIVSSVTVLFEVFNARRVAATLNTVTNSLTPGVTIPDLPALPLVLAPFASLLGPTSTRLAPVKLEAVVAREGAPVFDGGIVFTFGGGDMPTLFLAGVRVSVIPLIYETEFDERLTFPTATAEPQDGTNDQVVSLTANPVQSFSLTFLLLDEDRQRLQVLLFGSQAKTLALPLWHEAINTTASVSIGGTSLTVNATTDVDFRVGGYALVFESATKFDVVQLSAVALNTLTFTTTPLLYAYAAGVQVVPLRLGFIVNPPTSTRAPNKLEEFRLAFQVKDNDTGAPAGSTAGWSTFSGKVLLDDCNVIRGSQESTFTQRVTIIDNGTGAIQVVDDWDTNRKDSTKGFSMRSRAEYMKVKKLLGALRGPQRSFYLPTFAEDLTVAANLVSGSSTIDVVNIGYARHIPTPTAPKVVFRIAFTDGTSLIRTIQAVAVVSDTVERLTLDTTWPANRAVDEVTRIEFLELSRFASPSFAFRHERVGLVRMTAPVKTLLA